ncbi:hypothetical protein M011DRAFT_467671 [Sporormia fimetaria CBS 119925]|uniref:RING-type domain-containing protein n=1 Tax=Sporormia fimetaria CBS 119925 TaxID=1340428 RepID=A0A6A6VES9_9PLEO|nr:hypothetical protein M011DRAFT_467671 [Sporormia fimetaria CBS 119925]
MPPMRLFPLAIVLISIPAILFFIFAPSSDHDPALHTSERPSRKSKLQALFDFASPVTLFPPSALISLTDDNSTFFLARPAAFGSPLPKKGLSSPLWTGGGWDDAALSEGELGCSDVPGWAESYTQGVHDKSNAHEGQVRRPSKRVTAGDMGSRSAAHAEDGTDDHLVAALGLPPVLSGRAMEHADIQSIQEGAEIAGKIALIKRGGCGFVDKARWAQKRGAVAIIVGDNVRGGSLIRMYAASDTSDVAIPAIFTSYTTSHLLSSLIPSDDVRPLTPTAGLGLNRATHAKKIHSDEASALEGTSYSDAPGCQQEDGFLKHVLQKLGLCEVPHPHGRHSARATSLHNRHDDTEGSAKERLNNRRRRTTSDKDDGDVPEPPRRHKGLWVTLSPSEGSSIPFLDTLLVLVVSPLVTLTIVYLMLLIRAHLRRRRWRAPKSVVDRLPVRTYHTISDSSSSVTATPITSSPTAPLLQHQPPPPSQSRTMSEPPATSSSFQPSEPLTEEEKREAGLAEWRRRYGGRQKECVVCLEDFVDGVSRVMSLPCGHEFHAECITPWLVTRRRTCPICKTDVVRSLSQSFRDRHRRSTSLSRSPRVPHDGVDEIQAQAAETRNDHPSSSRPVPIAPSYSSDSSDSYDEDTEAGWADDPVDEARALDRGGSVRDLGSSVATVIWRGVDAIRGAAGLSRRPSLRDEHVDRDR